MLCEYKFGKMCMDWYNMVCSSIVTGKNVYTLYRVAFVRHTSSVRFNFIFVNDILGLLKFLIACYGEDCRGQCWMKTLIHACADIEEMFTGTGRYCH